MKSRSFIFNSEEDRNDYINRLLFISFLDIKDNNTIVFIESDNKKYISISFDDKIISIYFVETNNNEYGLLFKSEEDINLGKIFFNIYTFLYSENNKSIFNKEYKNLLKELTNG